MTSQHAITESLSTTLDEVADHANYSLLDSLSADPDSTETGVDHAPRQVFSGHYVPVKPTPIGEPEYIAHSATLFAELGFSDELARDPAFRSFFSGDLSVARGPLKSYGWATGYALSIFGQEYYHQCPFQTGNGYGDGRAISVLEGVFNDRRWEMQLKGSGRTPYCRGADGRAVLRSSVREFLAQEHMHALGVPTSRSLSLFVSKSEQVQRPWYSEGSFDEEPDRYVLDPAAISTRVASSFLRVGQLELFARRARKNEHPKAMQELEQILVHIIEREYRNEISKELPLGDQLLQLALAFRERLTTLVANWIRVGYCQGNFNSDNCAVGGFTLDYGPFGFMEVFDPQFQPWTGGGTHFAFFNQ
ncbi:MAG: protein adenylyltransferase SelO family protein, partial [Myxococcota bacterium]